MSWYSSSWKLRRAVTVDNSAGTGTSDVSITIDTTDAAFWAAIRSDGADLRVTDSDGVTVLTFKRSSFTYASRVLVIHVDDVTMAASATLKQLFVYVGYTGAGTPTDLVSSFVTGSTLTGYTFLAIPTQRVTRARPQRPGDTKPLDVFSKLTSEETYLFVDFSDALLPRVEPYEGSRLYEEFDEVLLARLEGGGASYASGWDLSKCRLFEGGLALYIAAGVSGTTYTAVAKVKSTLDRTLEHRALVKARNVSEQ